MNLPARSRLTSLNDAAGPGGRDRQKSAFHGKAKVEKVCRLCRRNRRGASAVEFALVAPVLFLLVFGIIEFGRMIMVQQVVINASREGARAAIIEGVTAPEDPAAVEERARATAQDLVYSYLEGAAIPRDVVPLPAVDFSDGDGDGYRETVAVTVEVPFSQVTWLPAPYLIPGDRRLTATTAMRRETTY
jgi:Flp pilus assembly protein TadG